MFADEIRRAVEAAPRVKLPELTALLWRAYGEGKVSEAEAEALSGLIEARTDVPAMRRPLHAARAEVRGSLRPPDPGISNACGEGISPCGAAQSEVGFSDIAHDRQSSPGRPNVGSRPRTEASLERRRRWAASGRLPPGLASRFTLAEQAVLALVAAETARRGDCRLAVGHLAAIVGVAETTVRNAIREAKVLGLLTVEERRLTGFRNDTNVVRIVSPEWTAWLRLARKGVPRFGETPSLAKGGGCKSAKGTPTQVSTQGKTRKVGPAGRSLAPLDPSSRETSRTAGARPRRCAGQGAAPGPR